MMKRLSIFLQLVLLLIYSSITIDGAGEAFDDRNVTAIKVLPYIFDPGRAPDEVVPAGFAFSADHHYGRRYTTSKREPNEYNLSKTFGYVTPGEIAESVGDALGYMRQVVGYHRVFNAGVDDPRSNKNVLLVRVRITATIQAESGSASGSGGCSSTSAAESSHEYFFGIFVSGAQKYRCGEVRDLISVSKDIPAPLKSALECKAFRDLWGNEPIRVQLRVYSLIRDITPDMVPAGDDVEEFLAEGVYKTPPLRLNLGGGVVKKFAPFSNVDGDLEKTIGVRLFAFPERHPLNAVFNAPNPATVPAAKALEVSMQREVVGVNREKLTQQLFGRPSYKDSGPLKACLAKKSDLDVCFNQSEQAYLSLLEGSFDLDINSLPHCYTTSPLPAVEGTKYIISKTEYHLYSFLDICRYCRGTLSHLLGSGKMHQQLADFFRKLKISADFTGSDMQILAFSYETTDT